MRKTNTAATVFNYYKNPETGKVEYRPTVLSSVHWENNKATNVISSGLSTADAVNIMIWFNVNAGGRAYVKPKQYAALSPSDVDGYWTLTQGNDRIVKGSVSSTVIQQISDITNAYDDCFTLKSVDTMDYGPRHMQHWEVSCS